MNSKNAPKQGGNPSYGAQPSGSSMSSSGPSTPASLRPSAPSGEKGSGMKIVWAVVVVVVIVGAFFLFKRPANDEAEVIEDESVTATVPAGISEIIVSRSADLSAHAVIKAGDTVIDEFDVTLESYSNITPVLDYVMDTYGADDPTLTYQSVLGMVTFDDVSRPAEPQ